MIYRIRGLTKRLAASNVLAQDNHVNTEEHKIVRMNVPFGSNLVKVVR